MWTSKNQRTVKAFALHWRRVQPVDNCRTMVVIMDLKCKVADSGLLLIIRKMIYITYKV